MNKKISFIIICLFLYSCGFQPMFQNMDLSKLNINKINYTGKNEINYLIKNYLNIEEKKNNSGFIVNLFSSESTSSSLKNTSGITTEENINVKVVISVVDSKNNNILSENFEESKKILLTNNISSDQENRRILIDKITKDITQKIKFKLQLISRSNLSQ